MRTKKKNKDEGKEKKITVTERHWESKWQYSKRRKRKQENLDIAQIKGGRDETEEMKKSVNEVET